MTLYEDEPTHSKSTSPHSLLIALIVSICSPQQRAGHFRVLYPTAENVARLWPVFRNPRFLNGILARWVLTGGLSNAKNRADIGLIAERLAISGMHDQAQSVDNGGKYGGKSTTSSMNGKYGKGRGWGHGGGTGDGRWGETASNATTVLSTTDFGGRSVFRGRAAPELWLHSCGARPVSSATSRASRPSLVRRPRPGASGTTRTTTAAEAHAKKIGGVQRNHANARGKGGAGGGDDSKKAMSIPASSICSASSSSFGSRGGAPRKRAGRIPEVKNIESREISKDPVPRLQLRRMESRVLAGPSLLSTRKPEILSTRTRNDERGIGDKRVGTVRRSRRASSASSSRPAIGGFHVRSKNQPSGRTCDGRVLVKGIPLGIGNPFYNRRYEGSGRSSPASSPYMYVGAVGKPTTAKIWGTTRRRPTSKNEEQEADFGADAMNVDCDGARTQSRDTGVFDATFIAPLGATVVESGRCLPRPPCRAAARHSVGENDTVHVIRKDVLPAFAAALLPSSCSKLAAIDTAASHSWSTGSCVSRAVIDASRGGSRKCDNTSSVGTASFSLLVNSRALKGKLGEDWTTAPSRIDGGSDVAREVPTGDYTAGAARLAAHRRNRVFSTTLTGGSDSRYASTDQGSQQLNGHTTREKGETDPHSVPGKRGGGQMKGRHQERPRDIAATREANDRDDRERKHSGRLRDRIQDGNGSGPGGKESPLKGRVRADGDRGSVQAVVSWSELVVTSSPRQYRESGGRSCGSGSSLDIVGGSIDDGRSTRHV